MPAVASPPGFLSWRRGDPRRLVLTVVDAEGDPVDLSASTWTAQVRASRASAAGTTLTTDATDAATGVLAFTLTGDQTRLLEATVYGEVEGNLHGTLLEWKANVANDVTRVVVDDETVEPTGGLADVLTVALTQDTFEITAQSVVAFASEGPGGDGADGREVQLQVSATHIQWRYEGEATWTNLIALEALAGANGAPGTPGADGDPGTDGREVELQTSATHVQWRYVGEGAWTNLVALSTITGPPGADGAAGAPGADGADGADGSDATVTHEAVEAAGALMADENLADVANAATARTNLDVYSTTEVDDAIANATSSAVLLTGNQTIAGTKTFSSGPDVPDASFSVAKTTGLQAALDAKAPLASPTFTGTVSGVTKSMVGLANVDNTADTAKPVSTAQQTALDAKVAKATFPVVIGVALSDETTALTTGTAKLTIRAPFAFTLTGVRATLKTSSSSGIPTVDINEGGTTVLSTKLTIDQGELTSTTAATAAVISDSAIADDAEITFDIDVAGTGAAGLKVWLLGTRVVS